ncbi:two-component sensor histidine kinase [Erythrobacter sp. 3-20A1M]|uniref:ATP-binding protein n=1 Tax=Erythrobacter sp. 3-20A1M TaxID=2653850 RepID=UPI001BFC2277|nr:ATP-binding protein [Erythrobacter sp. 3-20A1M]QWC58053.1 two-component sensor histidine kinase [Erythrobacter sp. 3-20A1M]
MDSEHRIPVAGLLLALIGSAAPFAAGLSWELSLGLLLVWGCSLFILPSPETRTQSTAPTAEAMRATFAQIIEHSATPLMLTVGNRVVNANNATRTTLGAHVIGQDVRVALRHPNAVELLDSGRNGETVVTGLVRRQDIWRISQVQSDLGFNVVELTNRTAEADVSRAHTDFVANASHELRTPLASILGYIETLQEAPGSIDSKTSTRFLEIIHREAQRMQNLVSDLMSLSRVEAEKHDLPETNVDLGALVRRAAVEGAGHERRNRLTMHCKPDIVVRGDAQQLEQLVRNLVDNALKYGAADGPVTVELTRYGVGNAQLSVADTGDGIPAEHIPLLTRRFYRTDPGRSRAAGGTGLGLAIVKHIVERHQGRLDIESTPGQGTRVSARLPMVETDPSQSLPEQAGATGGLPPEEDVGVHG